MSNDETSKAKQDQESAAKPDAIQDLENPTVSNEDADQVKGGVNPQPLPPLTHD